MSPRPGFLATVALCLMAGSAVAQQTRTTGVIGQYTPPRVWPVRQPAYDLQHQVIHVAFDVPKRLVTGRVTTTLVTRAPTDTVRLDAGNLTIDGATDAGGRKLRFTADTSHITVRLPHRTAKGDTVVFTVAYHTVPERGIYFVPRRHVIWSQGEATETRNWVPTYDAADDKTTWEFFVTADTGMKVLSNGRLVDIKPAANGQQVWHWSQEKPASTYLYSVVVGPFTILHDEWRGRPVEYYVYPDTALAAWRTFGETPSMIELYSRLLGVPFQWAKYDESVIPDFTYGGMENVSATTQTDLALHPASAEPEQDGRSLNAHELAHQWFGDLTTTANWANIWLNEGLTTYMESVQEEKTRGWAAAQLNWYNQQQQAMAADLNEERPLVWGKYQGDDPIALFFSGHVYPKGAQTAHQLRRLLGDSLFWAGMHQFLVDNEFKPVTTKDFAVAFEKVAHRDLDWFFDQWCYGIGYPKVDVTRHWDAGSHTLHVTVRETQPIDSLHPFFRFPTTIRVVTADSVVRQDIMVTKPEETFSIPLPSEPLTFRFDEGGWLLGTVHTDQTPAELSEMARHDLDFAGRNWALHALQGSTDSAAVAARQFIVLNEHEPSLRALALSQMGDSASADRSAPSRQVVVSALGDPSSEVRAEALRAYALLDSSAARDSALRIYRTDPSTAMHAAGLVWYARLGGEADSMLINATATGNALLVRTAAVRELARRKGGSIADALVKLIDPAEPRGLRGAALNALSKVDPARAAEVAGSRLNDYDPLFAVQAVRTLAQVGGGSGQATLQRALKGESRVTVKAAIQRALHPQNPKQQQ